MMKSIRPAAVSGMFYPADAVALRQMIHEYLAQAPAASHHPKAIIVPHAGYIYSAPVAAQAFRQLEAVKSRVRRVVLLGPSHRVAFHGLAMSSADAFETPLGPVPLDRDALDRIKDLPQVIELNSAHAQEHALEVELPFLQEILEDFSLVPLVVGDARPEEVAEVLERLWGGDETLIVISSDLSHYNDYDRARTLDEQTCRAIEQLHEDDIGYQQACGRLPISGLLQVARRHGLKVTTLDLRNSGDTAGPRDQVVGYGAWVAE